MVAAGPNRRVFVFLAVTAVVASALPSKRSYVLLKRGDENEVRKMCRDHPGLHPFEFVLPVSDVGTKSLEILGSWSDFQDKHRMRKNGDDFCLTLLLPAGQFNFQVYRNGGLASKKVHSLRTGGGIIPPGLANMLPDAKACMALTAHVVIFLLALKLAAKLVNADNAAWIQMARSLFVMPKTSHRTSSPVSSEKTSWFQSAPAPVLPSSKPPAVPSKPAALPAAERTVKTTEIGGGGKKEVSTPDGISAETVLVNALKNFKNLYNTIVLRDGAE